MKIGIVTTWFPAGAGYVSKAYRHVLEQQGNTVYIYARSGQRRKGDVLWDHSQVTWAPKSHIGTGIWKRHFQKWLSTNRITHVFFNEQRYWAPILWAKECGVICGAYVDYYTQTTVDAFSVYDFLVCNTKRHYSVFKWHRKCHYIPWGTDVNKFKPKDFKEKRPVTFLVSAGWEPASVGDRRGSLLALKAFKQVRGVCRLIFYSQVHKEQMPTIWSESFFGDERIEVRVGSFEPFPFSNGDVYLYPSRLDGVGLTLPEAVSSGLVAIVPNSAPMNEFVEDGVTGKVVEVEKYLGRADGYYWAESICNVDLLTKAMQYYVDNTLEMEKHKECARKFAETNLDWEKNSLAISEIFHSSKAVKITCEQQQLIKRMDAQYSPNIMQQARRVLGSLRTCIIGLGEN